MKDKIAIVGSGLVGSLIALLLRQKKISVKVYEKRKDPRKSEITEGRSINLALSRRGILPLKKAGVFDQIKPFLIPMKGRMIHDEKGKLTYQSYGKEGQYINSVSRTKLNELLIEEAEKRGAEFFFDYKCRSVDLNQSELKFENNATDTSDLIIGADGALSTIRKHLQNTDRFNFSQNYIAHGYKELNIEPINGTFALDANYLHIWPRGKFMLIALPNSDKTFTCTLFFPFEGSLSFETLRDESKIYPFFKAYFPDVLRLIPDLTEQFTGNPTSSLVTTQCYPWHKNNTILLGDAAHAIVPFYGQGMNSGFEGIRLFMEMAEKMNYNWPSVLPHYSGMRKKDTDAISELALHNFIEMRDHVGDPGFLKRKKLESQIQEKYPNEWVPLYSMVTFSDLPYSEALRLGRIQHRVINEFLSQEKDQMEFQQIIDRFNILKKDD